MALHLQQLIIGAGEADVERGGDNNTGCRRVAAAMQKVEVLKATKSRGKSWDGSGRFRRRHRGESEAQSLIVLQDQPLSFRNQYDAGLAPVGSHVALGLYKRCGSLWPPLRPIVRRRPPCV